MQRWPAVLFVAALAACRPGPGDHNNTAVLGGAAPGAASAPAGPPAFTDARGEAVPAPPVAAGTLTQLARAGDEGAVAVWVRDGQVRAAAFDRARGWSTPQPLEQIRGQATDPQLAANGQGSVMAVWRHTVGSIQSLRYSRFDIATGWSTPDVLPGALPRPHAVRMPERDAPQLHMDAQGNVTARWPSGFDAAEMQVARYVPGQGWSRAVSERLPPAPSASAASAASSVAR